MNNFIDPPTSTCASIPPEGILRNRVVGSKCTCNCNFDIRALYLHSVNVLNFNLVGLKKRSFFKPWFCKINSLHFVLSWFQISTVENKTSPHSKFQERQFWSGIKVSRKTTKIKFFSFTSMW